MSADAMLAEIMRRADFIFAGWNVLMAVGLGLLAAAGFAFFALTHLLGVLHVAKQWASLADALRLRLAAEPALAERLEFALMAPHVGWIVPFHLAFDALVLAGLWRLTAGALRS